MKTGVCLKFWGRQVDRYGQRKVVKIYNDMERLRKAIRSEGTPAIQEAWDRIEPVVDMFYQPPPAGGSGGTSE